MESIAAFFEIPASDFERAVSFYEKILGVKLSVMDSGHEKMAFFPRQNGCCPGAISWTSKGDFVPSEGGVMLSLRTGDMAASMESIRESGGNILTPKTKIQAEGRGWFSVFTDCEGNRLELYSDI